MKTDSVGCATCGIETVPAPFGWDAFCKKHLGIKDQETALSLDASRYTLAELEYLTAMGVNVLKAIRTYFLANFPIRENRCPRCENLTSEPMLLTTDRFGSVYCNHSCHCICPRCGRPKTQCPECEEFIDPLFTKDSTFGRKS